MSPRLVCSRPDSSVSARMELEWDSDGTRMELQWSLGWSLARFFHCWRLISAPSGRNVESESADRLIWPAMRFWLISYAVRRARIIRTFRELRSRLTFDLLVEGRRSSNLDQQEIDERLFAMIITLSYGRNEPRLYLSSP